MGECICCCCYQPQTTRPTQRNRQVSKKKKPTKVQKPTRLRTKYKKDDFVLVDDEERHEKRVKAYCCPICTLYYTRTLACSECVNFICLNCFEGYDKKTKSNKEKLKCPFCSSEKSYFCDYELDPHSYFDTTNKGFLPKQEIDKIEAEIKQQRLKEKVEQPQQQHNQEEPQQAEFPQQ